VLLGQSQILKLISLKKSIEEIQKKFSDLNSKKVQENFSSIIDFISYISNQQEVLSSELWKLESFTDYVESISQSQNQKLCSSMNDQSVEL
jgi:chromosome segregation ATPase